ncbi:hypothetical protein, partial [Ruminococcus sp.]|uniref:hypothetical protein n=1 Tax=Ruminococcus sp. TaxID=41978 RepID=UPI003FD8EED6
KEQLKITLLVQVTYFCFRKNFLPRLLRLVHSQSIINALAKNSPPDCFLNARLQVLKENQQNFKRY